jgi:hypothetical protein
MGNPARVVSYEGSFEFIRYDGMEADPQRASSLLQATMTRSSGAAKAPTTNGHGPLAAVTLAASD